MFVLVQILFTSSGVPITIVVVVIIIIVIIIIIRIFLVTDSRF